ncbi:MAG TPA: aminoglycoside phosphotransferase family protein [Acidimicrobiales bacterium]|nr:aminoglycoside phosphotransferase family protein [Acidimicrobiales bacterium]
MAALEMPENLLTAATQEGRTDWLETLPAAVDDLARRWNLSVGRPFRPGGRTAWVAPARDADGSDLVLKLMWRHPEAAHEADALRLWAGEGAVRLHAVREVDDHTTALLLERCRPGHALSGTPEEDQDVVVAGLLRRLWREPESGHPFRSLASMCAEWADEFEAKAAAGGCPLEPAIARRGMDLFRSLPATSDRALVLCTDLHAGNVLAARREPWLVIDPKPYVGDPTYDALQHILNCPGRLGDDPVGLARRMASLAGLDPERLKLWLLARCVQESPEWPGLADVARRLRV